MKIIKLHIKIIFIIILYYLFVFITLDDTCLIKHFTGVNCPTCGMSRSLFALLNFDIATSIQLNLFTVPTFIAVLLAIHQHLPIFSNKYVSIYIYSTLFFMFIYYLLRTF